MMLIFRTKNIFFVITALVILGSCSEPGNINVPEARQGVIDIRESSDEAVLLNGQWAYYHRKLYAPDDFKNMRIKEDTFLTLPSIWNVFSLNGEEIPGDSYATYRLKVVTESNAPILKIRGREQSTSYKLWVGDSLIAQAGSPASTKEDTKAQFMTFLKSFSLEDVAETTENHTEFYITLQIANYEHVNGGPWWGYSLGKPEVIDKMWFKQISLSLLIAGIILIMSLYHFILFFLQRDNFSYLFFALMALALFTRVLSTNERLLLNFLPHLSAEGIMRIEYLSAYSNMLFLPFFFFALYKKDFHKIVAYIIAGLFVFTVIIIGFFDLKTFSSFKDFFNLVLMAGSVYLIFVMMPVAIYRKRAGAIVALLGLVVMTGAGIYDIFLASEAASSGNYIAPYGLLFFIVAQSYVLAKRFSLAYKSVEKLSDELDYKNQNLENIVEKRTLEIEEQKTEISEKNEELLQQNEEITAQKEEVEQSRMILEQKNEQVKKSITYAATIQKAMLPLHDSLSKRFEHFVVFKPKDIVSGDFYWTSFFHPYYVFVAVVDCTGHGVPGSFMSMIGSHTLREIVNERQIFEPKEILEQLNKDIALSLQQESTMNKDGMDLALCRFEKQKNGTRNVTYCGAKIPLYHFSQDNKEVTRIKATRRSIGGLLNKKISRPFEQINLQYQTGDMLYMATDGFIDQNNKKREKISSTGFTELIEAVGNRPVNEQKSIINNFLDRWQEGTEQRDDITILGLKL